ncbi:unnamed protein product [Paramecium sonneborni]|uniref:Transmembrane protein n=1 Tax=Paramecium sonneborni TaxID=65129 RepID=A0A8S1Q0S4_9CILI|nr:unnamed protein product [Paramecium sonneborni]
MDYTLSSLLAKSQNKQMQVIIINNNNQDKKYQLFQTQLNQFLKCQKLTERYEGCLMLNSAYLKKQNKSLQIKNKQTKNSSVKQQLSMPQQLHLKFIKQKQREFVQFLFICLTIISLIVIIVEYHYLNKQRRFYDC